MTNYKAFYWQSRKVSGLALPYADKWMFEDGLDRNPPRAARAYALIAAAMFDAFIASQDGKFAYGTSGRSSSIPRSFHSSRFRTSRRYPSNHSTFSATRSEILAYLFPSRADFIRAVGKEAGDSRIWAGIHYQMDNVAGVQLGKSVAGVFISRAEKDGSLLIPIGTESEALTGSIDLPAEGAVVTGKLNVSGWARVSGSDLGVTVLIDGAPRYAIHQARVPRPGVQAALPSLGDCSTAGYESSFPFYPGEQRKRTSCRSSSRVPATSCATTRRGSSPGRRSGAALREPAAGAEGRATAKARPGPSRHVPRAPPMCQ